MRSIVLGLPAAGFVTAAPVIANGEMVAEYHRLHASDAPMPVHGTQLEIAPR